MATEVQTVTWCDRHLSEDGTREPGESWEVTIRGPGRNTVASVVDACPSCAEVLVAADAFLTTYGRAPGRTRRNKRAGDPPAATDAPAAEVGGVACPECGARLQDRGSVMRHMRAIHGMTLAEWEAEHGPAEVGPPPKRPARPAVVSTCPECGRTYRNGQALGAHRWRSHQVAGTSKDAERLRNLRTRK